MKNQLACQEFACNNNLIKSCTASKQETLTQLARGKVSIESMMTCQIVVLAVLDIVLLSRLSLPTAKGTLQCKMRRASNSTQLRILAY